MEGKADEGRREPGPHGIAGRGEGLGLDGGASTGGVAFFGRAPSQGWAERSLDGLCEIGEGAVDGGSSGRGLGNCVWPGWEGENGVVSGSNREGGGGMGCKCGGCSTICQFVPLNARVGLDLAQGGGEAKGATRDKAVSDGVEQIAVFAFPQRCR